MTDNHNLKQRVITALYGAPFLIAAVWFDEPLPWFTIFLAFWGAMAVFEFYRLVSSKVQPLTYLGITATVLLIASPQFDYVWVKPLILTSAIVLSLLWSLARRQKGEAFAGWAWTMGGMLYIGWLLSYFAALRDLEAGRNWVFLTLFTIAATDTAAFFVGRTFGKHKLALNISPNKTWEGAIAGSIAAILISLVFTIPALHLNLSYWQAPLLGLMVSVFAQLGDLTKSLFKRNMGVKDSSNLLKGHGGFLDRLDSILFGSLVVYFYVILIAGGG